MAEKKIYHARGTMKRPRTVSEQLKNPVIKYEVDSITDEEDEAEPEAEPVLDTRAMPRALNFRESDLVMNGTSEAVLTVTGSIANVTDEFLALSEQLFGLGSLLGGTKHAEVS